MFLGCPSPAVKPPASASPAPSPAPSAAAAQHPTVQKMLMSRLPAATSSPPTRPMNSPPVPVVSAGSPRPSSRDSATCGVLSKHPNLVNKLMNSIGGSKADSVGTPEDSLSGPPSPESLVSGVGTESPVPNSPRSVRSLADLHLPANCHLEVCEKAQEAKNVIEMGENHEAKIIRIGEYGMFWVEKY